MPELQAVHSVLPPARRPSGTGGSIRSSGSQPRPWSTFSNGSSGGGGGTGRRSAAAGSTAADGDKLSNWQGGGGAPMDEDPFAVRHSAQAADGGLENAAEQRRVIAVAGNPRKPPEHNQRVVAAGSNNPKPMRSAHGDEQKFKYFDYNFHAVKKGVSSALLDVALLMANASQLKSVYVSDPDTNQFYYVMMVLLISSIVLQVVVGLVLIWLGRININDPDDSKHRQADILNNVIVISVFILTVVNVFIASIGISDNPGYATQKKAV